MFFMPLYRIKFLIPRSERAIFYSRLRTFVMHTSRGVLRTPRQSCAKDSLGFTPFLTATAATVWCTFFFILNKSTSFSQKEKGKFRHAGLYGFMYRRCLGVPDS